MDPTAAMESTSPESGNLGDAPPCPLTLEETGLSEGFIAELILKTLFRQGALSGEVLARYLALAYPVIDDLLLTLQQRHFVEVVATRGHGRSGYTFSLTDEGQKRATMALEASRYVGPAPVPMALFEEWVKKQSVKHVRVGRERLERAFSDLVFPDEVFDTLGPAVNSGSSIFLHGAPGNGKTAIAERLGQLVSETIYLPRALIIEGSVMILEDPVFHQRVDAARQEGVRLLRDETSYDRRFAHVRRPSVFVGGELTLDQLDLQYDPYSRVYQAPFQLKATGGVLLIDDFGRQRMGPAQLLNRWIVPLEKHFDTLSLHTGTRFHVPFDCLLVFATNLNPRDLVDEAFLRRIQFKVEIKSPTRKNYAKILEGECDKLGVTYEPEAVELLFRDYYEGMDFRPRGCHPRDILHQIDSLTQFAGGRPSLDPDLIHRAARSYFLVMEEEYVAGIPSIEGRTSSHA